MVLIKEKQVLLLLLPVLCLIAFFSTSCRKSEGFSGKNPNRFIASKYSDQAPLAQILNPPNYADLKTEFELPKDTIIRVYAVGEIMFNLTDSEKRYYLENDGFELYFSNPEEQKASQRLWINLGTKSFGPNGLIKCKWTKFKNYKYIAHLKIPLSELYISSNKAIDSLACNIVIADNDDGFLQKAKLSWKGTKEENLQLSLGSLRLRKTLLPQPCDTISDSNWEIAENNKIGNVVYGFVKDKFDLSAHFKYAFDGDNLFLRVEVLDSRQKTITKKKLKERSIFVDYGWLENSVGDTIWEMHAKRSTYAGGGLKNQKVDTTLHLKAGKYFLYYKSDESHSPGCWTEPPPSTPFYGVVIYDN